MKIPDSPPLVEFIGPYAEICKAFIIHKRKLGFRYTGAEQWLRAFDNFCATLKNQSLPTSPDENLIKNFLKSKPYLSDKSKSNIYCVFRRFGAYLTDLGHPAYIPAVYKIKHKDFIPYIYKPNEIKKLLRAADSLKLNRRSPYMHVVLPAVIRMLYGCGLRISEALTLTNDDVDLGTGILTIRDSKFEKDRLVPMSQSLMSVCQKYAQSPCLTVAKSRYFFPAPDSGHLSAVAIRGRVHELLFKTGVGKGLSQRPRLHDLRHTFAVNCLHKWNREGKDILSVLPVLATYMGHETYRDTVRYLRLTPEVFPEITHSMAVLYADIFVEGGRHE